jgi:hypothetical protein
MYKSLQENGEEGFAEVHLFNSYFIFKLFIYYFFLYIYSFFRNKSKYFNLLLKIFGLSLFLFTALSSVTPIVGYRMSEFFGVVEILLFPIIFLVFKSNIQVKIMVLSYIILLFSVNIFHKHLIFV